MADDHAAEQAEERPEGLSRRRQLEDTEMDITPMIDITFLLLIFFLVASKMQEAADVDLPPAKRATPVPTREAVFLTVLENEGGDVPRVFKGNSTGAENMFAAADFTELETAIFEYVKEQAETDSSKTWLLIQGAGNCRHGDVSRVAKASAKVEQILNMAVAVAEVQ